MRGGRVKVENTFGMLKNRWQILKCLDCDLEQASTYITACCILHNFCQKNGAPMPLPMEPMVPLMICLGLQGGQMQMPLMQLGNGRAW
jgi:hypothetical protein